MDTLISAAARALALGDPLGALKRVALREDAPSLALRGIAMAQLGDFDRARALLRRAETGFHPREAVARARCLVAQASAAGGQCDGLRHRCRVSRQLCYSAVHCQGSRVCSKPIHEPGDLRDETFTCQILREYGPFQGADRVGGVTFDGENVWFASGDRLIAFDPDTGEPLRNINVAADAGTAFDGRYLFQITEDRIDKIDPETGTIVATIPAPGGGGDSGLTWAEGSLWVGHYQGRKIQQIDPDSGKS